MAWAFENRISNLGFVLALVILVAISLDSYRTTLEFEKTVQWKVESQEVVKTLSGILTLLAEAESARRGYIITGDERQLEPYHEAIRQVEPELDAVRHRIANNPSQQKRLEDLEPLIKQKLTNLREAIDLSKKRTGSAADQVAITEQGKTLMDGVRRGVNQMMRAQTELSRQRDREMHSSAKFSIFITAAGDALGFGLLVFVFYLLNREIAQRRRNQEVIRGLNEDLQRRATELAAANQELEAFAYSVSHDLRAPLQGIELSMALLEDEQEALSEECREYLQRVRSASRRMAELIQSLLKLSKITMTELRREPVDLSGLAQAIAGQLQKVQPERPVHVEISPGITASADPQLLRVALENLLGNAWKFTSNQPAARIEVGAEVREGEEQVYFVRDNGAGFDMAKAGKLFVPFQRLHETAQFEGVGIGLATVHRIIHKHGGRIWAEAAPGKGATFYFTLP